MIRSVLAPNPSPLTLDGTRTYIVGRARVAVVDPGPALNAHLDAVAETVGDGVVTGILLTHVHADHAAGAKPLAERLGAPLRARTARTLSDGDRIETDAGTLVAVATPGHTPDHFAFHLPAMGAVLCGDLMTGGLDTALVAKPEGDLTAYLASLDRVRALAPEVILPAHGPAFDEPAAALDAYVRHRGEREAQVLAALERAGAVGGRAGRSAGEGDGEGAGRARGAGAAVDHADAGRADARADDRARGRVDDRVNARAVARDRRGGARGGRPEPESGERIAPAPLGIDALVDAVYGAGLDPALRGVAAGAVAAYLEHLEAAGRVRRVGGGWTVART